MISRGSLRGMCAVAAAVAALGAETTAHATMLDVVSPSYRGGLSSLRLAAEPGETNVVTLTPLRANTDASGILVSDPFVGRVASSPLSCPIASPRLSLCVPFGTVVPESLGGFGQATLQLGDGNDSVRVDERLSAVRLVVIDGPGDDTLVGGRLPDEFFASAGADDFRGGPGTDQVTYDGYDESAEPVTVTLDDLPNDGAAGDDRLDGDEGADVIDGGPGIDRIDAAILRDADDDTILIRDGERDTVTRCGAGVDVVEADPIDQVAADCEDVRVG
jgi:hypothetical protein